MFRDFSAGEVVLLDKPYRWTSFDAVSKVRALLKYKLKLGNVKTGHAGTLDPLATGLLIICTGKFTKRIEEFQSAEKEYTGTFTLGITTPSCDLETEISPSGDCQQITESQLHEAAHKLTGAIMQIPPLFSARYIAGKRAYTYARAGKEIELPAKEVQISIFEITGTTLPVVSFRIVCSKGTYIRSVARDFGQLLGCGACLTGLRRTRIGAYRVEDALSPEEFEDMILKNPPATTPDDIQGT